jgi:hypothetical protein
VKKVNKNSPALRENSPALLCIFSGQTAHSPRHYTRNARITKIGFYVVECPNVLKKDWLWPNLLRWGLPEVLEIFFGSSM